MSEPRSQTGPDGLTDRQREIYAYIFECARTRGFQPSLREICARFGMSSTPNGATCHLKALERKGWLRTSEGEKRANELLKTPDGRPFTGFSIPA